MCCVMRIEAMVSAYVARTVACVAALPKESKHGLEIMVNFLRVQLSLCNLIGLLLPRLVNYSPINQLSYLF